MSTDPAHFDRLYSANPDPWRFETSAYEAAKLDACMALLPDCRFASALEIGCSIGVSSAALAARCDHVLALDLASAAIDRARARRLVNVEFRQARIPRDWPDGVFDLIVLSEILYFLDATDIARTAALVARSLAPQGCILLCSWLGPTETELDGKTAQDLFIGQFRDLRPRVLMESMRTSEFEAVSIVVE